MCSWTCAIKLEADKNTRAGGICEGFGEERLYWDFEKREMLILGRKDGLGLCRRWGRELRGQSPRC